MDQPGSIELSDAQPVKKRRELNYDWQQQPLSDDKTRAQITTVNAEVLRADNTAIARITKVSVEVLRANDPIPHVYYDIPLPPELFHVAWGGFQSEPFFIVTEEEERRRGSPTFPILGGSVTQLHDNLIGPYQSPLEKYFDRMNRCNDRLQKCPRPTKPCNDPKRKK